MPVTAKLDLATRSMIVIPVLHAKYESAIMQDIEALQCVTCTVCE